MSIIQQQPEEGKPVATTKPNGATKEVDQTKANGKGNGEAEIALPVAGTTLEDQNSLIAAGYSVVLCKGKAALVPEWQTKTVTKESNAQDRARHPLLTNTGIRCGQLVGIDIDLHDKQDALTIKRLVEKVLGVSAYVRVGSKGCAIFFYCPEGVTSSTVRGKAPGAEGVAKALIEVFGHEKQMVMFGIHPDTLKPYKWANKSLMDAPLVDLPQVTPKMVATMRIAMAKELTRLGYTNWSCFSLVESCLLTLGLPSRSGPGSLTCAKGSTVSRHWRRMF